MIDVPPLSAVSHSQITAFSSVPSSFVLCFTFYCFFLSDWISMVSVCVGLWIWNVCVWYCVYGSGVSSLVSACVHPCGSLSFPQTSSPSSSSPFRFSFVTVSGRRLLLRRSRLSLSSRNLHLSLRLRPSTFGSHSSAFSALVSRVESRS